MAKPNYQFEKRQRDLAKKNKKEEKSRQKLAGKAPADASDSPGANSSAVAPTAADDVAVVAAAPVAPAPEV